MNLNRKKKGFTIVELVIVIAVIGVLAAILIPTFVGLVNRANITSDNSLVRDLNNAIAIDSSTNGKHKTMHDALAVTDEYGFNVSRINAKANKSEILWDSKNDVFCYFDGNEIKYIPETTLTTPVNEVNDYDYFVIRDVKTQGDVSTKYSTYLRSCELTEITTTKGLDVGETTLTSITYNGGTTAQDVVIRTNSDSTNIVLNPYVDSTDSTLGDHIEFYGEVGSITGPKDSETGEWTGFVVATHSFKINGKVKYVQIADGRIVLGPEFIKANKESESKTSIHIEKQDDDTFGKNLIISYDSNLDLEKYITLSRDDVEIAETGTLVIALQNGTEEITESTSLDYIWLTKQGIYEQIKVSDSKVSAGEVWADDASNSEKTQEAAQQIANNIGRDAGGNVKANVTIGSTEYTVTLDVNRNIVVKDSNDNVIVETNVIKKVTSSAIEPVADKESIQIGATLFAGGTGTETDPFLIVDYPTFQHVSDLYEEGYYNFKVKDGIETIDCKNWKPVFLYGSIDGNGVTLNNLDKWLFDDIIYGDGTVQVVKDMTVNCRIIVHGYGAAALCDDCMGNVTFENIDVNGYIEGRGNSSVYVAYGSWGENNNTLRLKNCGGNATLLVKQNGPGIYMGHHGTKTSIILEDCHYSGTAYSTNGKAYTTTDYTTSSWASFTEIENGVELAQVQYGKLYANTNQITYNTIDLGSKTFGDNFEITASGSSYAVAEFMIAPNGNGVTVFGGSYTATYMSEALTISDGKYTTSEILYYHVAINPSDVEKTGLDTTTGTFNVVNSSYNNTYGSASVMITEYDANNNVIAVWVWSLPVE